MEPVKNSLPFAHVSTPLGTLSCHVESVNTDPSCWELAPSISTAPFEPKLPPGMSVLGCEMVLLQCTADDHCSGLTWECRWVGEAPVCSGRETGEGLDALGWEDRGHKVMVGTEDFDFLEQRLRPGVAISASPYPVIYSEKGIKVCIGPMAKGAELSLHFALAWSLALDPDDCSCWYAVGISHAEVCARIGMDDWDRGSRATG